MPTHQPNKPRAYFFFALQWGISLSALTYALWDVDFNTLFFTLCSYPWWAVLLPLPLLTLDYASMALRLQSLLPANPTYLTALRGVILCMGYNNILPAKAGDVLKIVYLSKAQQLPLAVITPSIVWERCLDLLILTFLTVLAVQFTPLPLSLHFSLVFLLLFALVFYSARRFSSFFHVSYDKYLYPRLATLLHTLHTHAVDTVLFRTLGINFLLSCVIWSLHFATFVLCFSVIAGLPLTLPHMLVVFVVTCLGTALPSSPANLGLFEGAMVLSLSWYGIGHSEALGIALYIHALYFFPITLIALWVGRTYTLPTIASNV